MNRLLASTLLLPACTSTTTRSDESLESVAIAGISSVNPETGLTRIAIRLDPSSTTEAITAVRLLQPMSQRVPEQHAGATDDSTMAFLVDETNHVTGRSRHGLRYIDTILVLDPTVEEHRFIVEADVGDGVVRGDIEIPRGGPSPIAGTAESVAKGLKIVQPKVSGKTRFKRAREGRLLYDLGDKDDSLLLDVTVEKPDESFNKVRVDSYTLTSNQLGKFGLLTATQVTVHEESLEKDYKRRQIKCVFNQNDNAKLDVLDFVYLSILLDIRVNDTPGYITWARPARYAVPVFDGTTVEWEFGDPYRVN